MSEIQSYRDPQLVPPDVAEEMTPEECMEACTHVGACLNALTLCGLGSMPASHAAGMLRCGECKLFDESVPSLDSVLRLRAACVHLAGIIRAAEGMLGDVELLAARDRIELKACGVDVPDREGDE